MLAVTGKTLIRQLGFSFPFGLVRLPVVGGVFMSSIMVHAKCQKCGETLGIQLEAEQILEFSEAILRRRTPQSIGKPLVEAKKESLLQIIPTYTELKL